MLDLRRHLDGGLVPAVPVPFRGDRLDVAAQRAYAEWMAAHPVAGVAVWAHTGRGPHLTDADRRTVLETWREALPAWRGRADGLLLFPVAADPVGHARRLSAELPALAFWLYEAAGGVAWDDATLHAMLELPNVVGMKVATLDSVMTFQRLAALLRAHPDRLLVTGEDRFLGYSLMCGARAALVGMGAALPDLQAGLLAAWRERQWERFHRLSAICDAFAQATFVPPMEGYVRRMLWAAAADGALPEAACDDPWGPPLDPAERDRVVRAVHDARAAAGT